MRQKDPFLFIVKVFNYFRYVPQNMHGHFQSYCQNGYTQSPEAICAFYCTKFSLPKAVEKASPILVTLTSRSDSDVESSNVSLKENKPDGVNPNSNDIDGYVRKSERKILWF